MKVAERISVRCSAIVLRGDSVLLCQQVDGNAWVLSAGAPRRSEGAADCARREVLQETDLDVTPKRIAFVWDATSRQGEQHLFEIAFLATERDGDAVPRRKEDNLVPAFVRLGSLAGLSLRPEIADHLCAFAEGINRSLGKVHQATAAYLGNVWQPIPDGDGCPS
jgi:8-oxo-dGTP diphosphatase